MAAQTFEGKKTELVELQVRCGATRRREGSERTSSTEFSRFLDIAKGSAGEVRSMYRLAVQLGFVSKEVADQRCAQCASISKQIAGFARFLRRK